MGADLVQAGSRDHIALARGRAESLGHDEDSKKQGRAKAVRFHSLRSLHGCRSSQHRPLHSRTHTQHIQHYSTGSEHTWSKEIIQNTGSSWPACCATAKRVHFCSSCTRSSLRRPVHRPGSFTTREALQLRTGGNEACLVRPAQKRSPESSPGRVPAVAVRP